MSSLQIITTFDRGVLIKKYNNNNKKANENELLGQNLIKL